MTLSAKFTGRAPTFGKEEEEEARGVGPVGADGGANMDGADPNAGSAEDGNADEGIKTPAPLCAKVGGGIVYPSCLIGVRADCIPLICMLCLCMSMLPNIMLCVP